MNPEDVDLEPLRQAIRQYKMMEVWRDGLFVRNEEQGRQRAIAKALEAKEMYTNLMCSKKNEGSYDFQLWAIKKTLGLRVRRGYTAQATGGKHWRSWGKVEARNDPVDFE